MKPLPFESRAEIAGDLVRRQLIRQLERSTGLTPTERRALADEILFTLTNPELAPSLQLLAAKNAPDPRNTIQLFRRSPVPPVPLDELQREADGFDGRYNEFTAGGL